MFNIVHFKTASGHDLVKDYLCDVAKKHGEKDLACIKSALELLKNHGFEANKYKSQVIRKIDDEIYELRPGKNRILFFYYDKKGNFVLLHGFRKETNKTPDLEKKNARKQMEDYKRRIK